MVPDSGDSIPMPDISAWTALLKSLLEQLRQMDFGYPLGANVIRSPQSISLVDECLESVELHEHGSIHDFYSACDGISLPDVHVGYFVKPVAELPRVRLQSEPIEVVGETSGRIVVFGSTGGGGLFALRRGLWDVLYLAPGRMESGTYFSAEGQVGIVASDFLGFLVRLLDDVKAFVTGERNHVFIAG
jgi:hypothetical protein